ncbi:hypothetical protein DYI37_00430 [Fulvimarina endophytica]|uniref:Type I secretion protein n=1 Tax=Fulvimarina endophytica TaxID=2293836 RepID=A0A371X9S3_9HYPH|nr:hypothetical protein [Fulvimarina endophytica]RFC65988.1 hypothetical protein DYI37_00430 [Fulvimarina endophytica]
MDIVTEEIAHFVGLFALTQEEMRDRPIYHRFAYGQADQIDPEDLPRFEASVRDRFDLDPYRPNVLYLPPTYELYPAFSEPPPGPIFPQVAIPELGWNRITGSSTPPTYAFDGPPQISVKIDTVVRLSFGELPPPDQIALLLRQSNLMQDVDIVEFIPGIFDAEDFAAAGSGLPALIGVSDAINPIDQVFLPPSSEAAIAEMIADLVDLVSRIEGFEPAGPSDHAAVFTGDDTVGTFVNGVAAEDGPSLADRLKAMRSSSQEEEDGDRTGVVPGEGRIGTPSTLEVAAGGNTAINEAILVDALLASPLMFVRGDYTSLDIIVQTNVLSDRDHLAEGFSDISAANEAMNVAVRLIEANDPFEGVDRSELALPRSFNVTRLEGNFVNIDWIEQTNRLLDDDWIGVARSGSQTILTTGENRLVNSADVVELGRTFDLIVVLQNVWKANVVHQSNIILDDDQASVANGTAASTHEISGGGNLAWNEASIVHVGETSLAALSPEAEAFVSRIAEGPAAITLEILQDPAFAGLGTLDVLVIEGSYLELDYVVQRNIVSDSDRLRIDEQRGSLGETDLDTGANVAINLAAIIEYGVNQQVQVGGTTYSDSIIYQAGFLDEGVPDLGSDLATEAVLFLADGMVSDIGPDHPDAPEIGPTDGYHDDMLQTMLT